MANLTRESIYPLWHQLSARADDARALFSAGGDELRFRVQLASLGFSGSAIDIEVKEWRQPSGAEP